MKELTADRVRELFDYDPDTGDFIWKSHPTQPKLIGVKAGAYKSSGYVRIKVAYREYLAHRLAWMHFYGATPASEIDHVNGVKTDNRISNLRLMTSQGTNKTGKPLSRTTFRAGFLVPRSARKPAAGRLKSKHTACGIASARLTVQRKPMRPT